MQSFAIYDAVSGEILRKGRGSERAAEIGLKDGEFIFWGEINPKTHFLPGGFPALKHVDPVVITAAEVKQHAGRILSYTDWVDIRALSGTPADPAMVAYRQSVRDASNEIEAMDPIPTDFRDPKYWPVSP